MRILRLTTLNTDSIVRVHFDETIKQLRFTVKQTNHPLFMNANNHTYHTYINVCIQYWEKNYSKHFVREALNPYKIRAYIIITFYSKHAPLSSTTCTPIQMGTATIVRFPKRSFFTLPDTSRYYFHTRKISFKSNQIQLFECLTIAKVTDPNCFVQIYRE